MEEFFEKLLETDFMPHGHCYYWRSGIVWTHAVSDGIIALAYLVIPLTLVHIVRRRDDFRYISIIILFSIFILGCGTTHIFDVINIWTPWYRLDSAIRVITAASSIGTALVLIKYTPEILLIPTADTWKKINRDLHQQMDQIRENQMFIQKITDISPSIIYVFDLNTKTNVYTNKSPLEKLGYQPDELKEMGDNFLPLLTHPSDMPALQEHFIRMGQAEDNEILEYEYRLKDRSGSYRWYLSRDTVFLRNEQGQVIQILGIATDITFRKEQEELLKKNQELLLDTQSLAHIGSYEWILEEDKVSCTPELYKIYEYDQGKAIRQKDFQARVHPEDLAKVKTLIDKAIQCKEAFSVEFRICLPGNKEKYILCHAQVFYNEEDNTHHMIGTNMDITERILVQQELKNIKEFVFLGEIIPQLVWTSASNGDSDYFNKRWYEYTGLTEQESLVRGWEKVIYPLHKERTIKTWQQSLATGEIYEMECCLRKFDGQFRWFLNRAIPMKDTQGRIIKWFGTCTDIQDQKTQTRELEAKNEDLIRINNDLDNFVYTASHDLKAPISNMEGLLNTIQDEIRYNRNEDVVQLLSMMETSVHKLKSTITDLADISKIQRNKGEEMERVDIEEILEEFSINHKDQIESNHAVIQTRLEVTEITFSKKNFRSILYNLLTNAIKYRSPLRDPVIQITTSKVEHGVEMCVEDNGIGLDITQKEKVFTMFKRLHTHVEGTGVGLYIVKRILENAGSSIDCDSQVGHGAIFKVYFKAAPSK